MQSKNRKEPFAGGPDRTAIPHRQRRSAFDGVFSELANQWQNWPSEPSFCGYNDGLPSELDGVTFLKWRDESVQAYGNAIVPQIALEIFRAIQDVELAAGTFM